MTIKLLCWGRNACLLLWKIWKRMKNKQSDLITNIQPRFDSCRYWSINKEMIYFSIAGDKSIFISLLQINCKLNKFSFTFGNYTYKTHRMQADFKESEKNYMQTFQCFSLNPWCHQADGLRFLSIILTNPYV